MTPVGGAGTAFGSRFTWTLIGLGAILGIIISIAILLAISNDNPPSPPSTEYCVTETCVRTAIALMDRMYPAIDPCEDFYRFTCAGFFNSSELQPGMNTIDPFLITEEKIKEKLHNNLREPIDKNDPQYITHIKNLYTTCYNTTITQTERNEQFNKILKELGGWPVLAGTDWKEAAFNWTETDIKSRKMGFSPIYFIRFGISIDPADHDKFKLYLDEAALDISPQVILNGTDSKTNPYYMNMVKLAVTLGADKAKAEAELLESFKFEKELTSMIMEARPTSNDSTDPIYPSMTVANLTQEYPIVSWLEYINEILPDDVTIKDDEFIMVNGDYLKKFETLIGKTSKRIQANYLMWRLANSVKDQLNPQFKLNLPTRWEYCFKIVRDLLPAALSSLYIRKYSKPILTQYVNEMVAALKKQYATSIKATDWLDKESKHNALDKLAAMEIYVGAHDKLLNNDLINKYHEGLYLDNVNYLQNYLNASRFEIDKSFRRLRQTVRESHILNEFSQAVITPNAVFYLDSNTIIIAEGLLQPIYLDINLPYYMNYGLLGTIISHEMSHSFQGLDNTRIALRNAPNWWTPKVKNKYIEKSKCFIEQYDKYAVTAVGGIKVNGTLTLQENIADNGGYLMAYLAYGNWAKNNKNQPKLPGLTYTDKQLFWISSISHLCSRNRKEYIVNRLKHDPHTVKEFRVIGTLSNLPQFARDFNCPVGSNMNPAKKCFIW